MLAFLPCGCSGICPLSRQLPRRPQGSLPPAVYTVVWSSGRLCVCPIGWGRSDGSFPRVAYRRRCGFCPLPSLPQAPPLQLLALRVGSCHVNSPVVRPTWCETEASCQQLASNWGLWTTGSLLGSRSSSPRPLAQWHLDCSLMRDLSQSHPAELPWLRDLRNCERNACF